MYFDIRATMDLVIETIYIAIILIFGVVIPSVLLLGTCDDNKTMLKIAIVWILIEAFIAGGLK